MSRNKRLLSGIDKSMLGLEVAPWLRPIAAKSDGFNIRSLDVFDDKTLMARAQSDPQIPPETYHKLESVDYVGSATEVADLVPVSDHGTFEYVISSHNFEHLPNPIKFLQGCEKILRDGGVLIMVVPDGRACFDYFRPHTTTSEWLEAFIEDRQRPTLAQWYAASADLAFGAQKADGSQKMIELRTRKNDIVASSDIFLHWEKWQSSLDSDAYVDAHCTVMTPSSLRLLIEDCCALGLINFDILDVSPTSGVEFSIRLKSRPPDSEFSKAGYARRRTTLLHDIWNEQAVRYMSEPHGSVKYAERARKSTFLGGVYWRLAGLIPRIRR